MTTRTESGAGFMRVAVTAKPASEPKVVVKPRPVHRVRNMVYLSSPPLVDPDNPLGFAHVAAGVPFGEYLRQMTRPWMDRGIGTTLMWPQGALVEPQTMTTFRGNPWPTRMRDARLGDDMEDAITAHAYELAERGLPPLTVYVVPPYLDKAASAIFYRFKRWLRLIEDGMLRLAFDSGEVLWSVPEERWFRNGVNALWEMAGGGCGADKVILEGPVPGIRANIQNIDEAINHELKKRLPGWKTHPESERLYLVTGLERLEAIGRPALPSNADWREQTLPIIGMAMEEARNPNGASKLHVPCQRFEEAETGSVAALIAAANGATP